MASWLSRTRQRVVQIVGTVLAIVLIVLLVREDGGAGVVAAMRQIPVADLLWVALLFLISRIAVIFRWHVLLRSGGVNIALKDSAMLTFTGMFASNFLPTTIGGDVLRMAGAMKMGYDKSVCLASIVADRLVGMFGMLMVAPLGSLLFLECITCQCSGHVPFWISSKTAKLYQAHLFNIFAS